MSPRRIVPKFRMTRIALLMLAAASGVAGLCLRLPPARAASHSPRAEPIHAAPPVPRVAASKAIAAPHAELPNRAAAPTPSAPAVPRPSDGFGDVPLRFEDYYEVTVQTDWEWPGADVKLLTTADPIPVCAGLRSTRPLPAGWREIGRGIRWSADHGELSERASARDECPARWTPPADSKLATLSAEAWVRLEPASFALSSPREEGYIFGSKKLRYLSALPAAGMKNGKLDGYRIGEFPALPHKASKTAVELLIRHVDRYQSPKLYYRVDTQCKPLKISPNLTLGAFVIDFPWGSLGMPQYIALDPSLPRKLELIIDAMRADGYKVATLTPIYGYRPPAYNLGAMAANPETNLKVRYSMHQYGRAFDFIIDEDGDLRMDDLNADGRIDARDSAVIMGYIDVLDHLEAQLGNWGLVGGAGLYARHDFVTRRQTPYVHVDTRGFLGTGGMPMRWSEE